MILTVKMWNTCTQLQVFAFFMTCFEFAETNREKMCNDELSYSSLQFTSLGHTQLRGNAMMITSTITVVLFSTVVRHKSSLSLSVKL